MPRSPGKQRQLVFSSETQEKDEDYRIRLRIKSPCGSTQGRAGRGWGGKRWNLPAEIRRNENLASLSCKSERMGERIPKYNQEKAVSACLKVGGKGLKAE